jgi:hypothetical protein
MVKLREGREYKFMVDKELTMPDESRHFVFIGPDENKYLVPEARYSRYGISPGIEVVCRVDRVNCKGEVFLEPRNPWYTEGQSYDFPVIGTEERIDNYGTIQTVIIVQDESGFRIPVPCDKSKPLPAIASKINLAVEKISKGRIYLVLVSRAVDDNTLISGRTYEFTIEKIEKGMDDEDYFVVKDIAGKFHTIAKEFYEYYGYSPGTKFKGKIIKYKKNGEKTIEPENPFYKPGSVLLMQITGFSENIINSSFTIDLKDEFGFTHCIETVARPQSGSVRCRIVMIRKGRPLLELL